MVLLIGILMLLAISGPLLVRPAYQISRGWGTCVGALWLLAALFFAGKNFGTALSLAFSRPFSSVAVLATVALGFYFAGPQSGLWQWAARLRPVRLAALQVRRFAHRHGLSRQLAGDVTAMAAALLVLAPVSLLTLKRDPAYDYALGKLQRELSRRLSGAEQLAQAVPAQARQRYQDGPGVLDPEAAAAGERTISDAAQASQNAIGAIKAGKNRSDSARREVGAIAEAARARLAAEMDEASRDAMAQEAERLLDDAQKALAETARRAMDAAVSAIVERARQSQAALPVDGLREATERLIGASRDDIEKAGRQAAEADAQRLLEEKRAGIEEAGRKASRESAEHVMQGARTAMTDVVAQLRGNVEEEEASRREQDRRRLEAREAARQREEEERAGRETARQAEQARAQALARFSIMPGTSFAGGQSLGHVRTKDLADCALACLSIGCDTFAFQKGHPHGCYRFRGRSTSFGNEFYIGGRLR